MWNIFFCEKLSTEKVSNKKGTYSAKEVVNLDVVARDKCWLKCEIHDIMFCKSDCAYQMKANSKSLLNSSIMLHKEII